MAIFDPDLLAGDLLHGGVRAVVALLLTKIFQRPASRVFQQRKQLRTVPRQRRRRR